MPPVIPSTGTLTIAQVRALYNGSNIKFTQDISLYATVTMTDGYKTLYLRDNTGAIMLRQLNAHGIYEGDSLRVNLNGSTLDMSGAQSSLQIDSVDVSSTSSNKIIKLALGASHPPIQLTIAQANASVTNTVYANGTTLPLSAYDGQLVQLNGVQFAPTATGLYIPLNTTATYITTLKIYDCGAVNSMPFSLYSGTSDFLYKYIPINNSGSIIGALTFYNGAIQITPRSYQDMMLNQPRCGVDTLTQSFAAATSAVTGSNFSATFPGWGSWTTYGSVVWAGSASVGSPPGYLSATNYNFGSPQARNEMWLVTPPIQNNNPNKKISFDMSMAFQTAAHNQQLSVLLSTNYQIDSMSKNPNLGLPNYTTSLPNANWVDITSSFSLNPSGSFVNAGVISVSSTAAQTALSGYNGTYYIAFRYRASSIADSSQTVNIRNVSIKN